MNPISTKNAFENVPQSTKHPYRYIYVHRCAWQMKTEAEWLMSSFSSFHSLIYRCRDTGQSQSTAPWNTKKKQPVLYIFSNLQLLAANNKIWRGVGFISDSLLLLNWITLERWLCTTAGSHVAGRLLFIVWITLGASSLSYLCSPIKRNSIFYYEQKLPKAF